MVGKLFLIFVLFVFAGCGESKPKPAGDAPKSTKADPKPVDGDAPEKPQGRLAQAFAAAEKAAQKAERKNDFRMMDIHVHHYADKDPVRRLAANYVSGEGPDAKAHMSWRVNWAQINVIDPFKNLGYEKGETFFALMANGSVKELSTDMDPEKFKKKRSLQRRSSNLHRHVCNADDDSNNDP